MSIGNVVDCSFERMRDKKKSFERMRDKNMRYI